jgi:thymidine phosphorylase
MFRLKHLKLDTLQEHVIIIHERAVREGNLGFNPLDRVRVFGTTSDNQRSEITGVLNFCGDDLVSPHEIGLSEDAFADLGLPEGTRVDATLAVAPRSVDLVRSKLLGARLDRAAFDSILSDIVAHKYSRIELAMFVLGCALKTLDADELADYTRAMIETGTTLNFGEAVVADKHCIGGVPGNRTTLIVVPILASMGLTVPKTSSRAITSPAGTTDTMEMFAEVALAPERLKQIVRETGACIAWGGALKLAPADDILITVERPMEIDTEAQMVASILAKKKSAGASHVLIDLPVGRTAKVRSDAEAQNLAELFRSVAERIVLRIDVQITRADGPIGFGIGPRLEALDVLAVLRRESGAPVDLREKSIFLASRTLEMTGVVASGHSYSTAERALDSGRAYERFEQIIEAQGRRKMVGPASAVGIVRATADGRVSEIDCWEIARVAKRAGAPANPAAGVRLLRTVGDMVQKGEPLYEVHASTEAQLGFARAYADIHPEIVRLGFETAQK